MRGEKAINGRRKVAAKPGVALGFGSLLGGARLPKDLNGFCEAIAIHETTESVGRDARQAVARPWISAQRAIGLLIRPAAIYRFAPLNRAALGSLAPPIAGNDSFRTYAPLHDKEAAQAERRRSA
jgi:hypothetical protein